MAEARALFAQVLEVQSDNFDALHLMGVVDLNTGQLQSAAELIARALAIDPNNANARYNHAIALGALGQQEASADSYLRAGALNPGFAEAHASAGVMLSVLKRHREALDSYDKALVARPAYAQVWTNRGNALAELGQPEAALASYNKALDVQPTPDCYSNRGNVLRKMGWQAQALESCDKALALNPSFVDAYDNRGLVLHDLGRYAEAVESYDRALSLKPDHAAAHLNRGIALSEMGRHAEAIESYDRAIEVAPSRAMAWYNAWNNHGVALTELGRHAEAPASYEQAIAINPANAEAHWNLGLCKLQLGDFERGWHEYEWRWKQKKLEPADLRGFAQPLWLGQQPLEGKTILLHAEQGLGDTLQFCRYAREVSGLGARVILEVQKTLASLLQGLEGVDELVARGQPLPLFDFHCPLLSLPLAFNTRLPGIPPPAAILTSGPASYDRRTAWEARLAPKRAPRVGLVWSGNASHMNDQNRSIALADLLEHLPPGPQYVSLQKDVRDADRRTLQAHPEMLNFGDELHDFTDTAALCALMDGVVSVDTSVAHLAGTLGSKLWLLLPFNPDWRWMLERSDSPWYPSATLCRQLRPGDWDSVMAGVGDQLNKAWM